MLDRLNFQATPQQRRWMLPALCTSAAVALGIWTGCAIETAWTSINRDLLADPAAYAPQLHAARCGDVCIFLMED